MSVLAARQKWIWFGGHAAYFAYASHDHTCIRCVETAAKVLDTNLQDKKYAAPNVQEWTSAICSQAVAALRGISGSFKYTGEQKQKTSL